MDFDYFCLHSFDSFVCVLPSAFSVSCFLSLNFPLLLRFLGFPCFLLFLSFLVWFSVECGRAFPEWSDGSSEALAVGYCATNPTDSSPGLSKARELQWRACTSRGLPQHSSATHLVIEVRKQCNKTPHGFSHTTYCVHDDDDAYETLDWC